MDNTNKVLYIVCCYVNTVQSLYNTPHYNTDLDIAESCGSPIFLTMEFYKGIIEN